MNSGMKAAVAWSKQISDLILARNEGFSGLDPRALDPFLDFMKRLREREHDQRSFVIQDNSGSPDRVEESLRQAHTSDKLDCEIAPELRDKVIEAAKSLEEQGRWPHEDTKDLSGIVYNILSQLRTRIKNEMNHSPPCPVKDMRGPEVRPPKPQIPNPPRSRVQVDTGTSQNGHTMAHTTSRWLAPAYMNDQQIQTSHGITASLGKSLNFIDVITRYLRIFLRLVTTVLWSLLVVFLVTSAIRLLFELFTLFMIQYYYYLDNLVRH